uniref:meiosis-specific coiled-coil domain-containing protein MEIOC n=1 Tax=Centroberyx gerrardi TaxID=166262 RepID=UPI003AAE448D
MESSVNGGSGNNGSVAQPFIPVPSFTLPEQDTAYIPWSQNAHDDPYELIHCAQNNIKSRNPTDGTECEGEADLHGLVSNILEEADSLDNYYAEGNVSTFKPIWSPKTMREDLLQYFQSESKTQQNPAFLPNHTCRESFNKAQAQPMDKYFEEFYQQFNAFGNTQQSLFTSSNGGADSYTSQPQKLPPGLPMPSTGNSYLSQIRQSKHDYISADKDRGNSGPMNNFPDLSDVFAPQSEMSSRCFDPYYADHSIQSSVKPMSNEQYAPQEVNKLVSNFQALMAGEQDSLRRREPPNTHRQPMEMHYEDSMAEQWKFTSPAMSTHSTPTMQIQKEQVGEFGTAQRERNGGVGKQTFQGDSSSQNLPGFNPQNVEYFQQPKPLSASFNPTNQYQNKMATHTGNASLLVTLGMNQHPQHHSQQSQMQNKIKPPRANCGPSNTSFFSQSVSEFVPQHSHQMQRGPLCIQDYSRGGGPSTHCQPGQGQAGTGLDSIRKRDGGSEMQLEKNRMHMAGFLGEGFNTRPHSNTHMRDGDKKQGLPQNLYFDLLGNMHNSQRFGGGNSTVSAGNAPQFVPLMYPVNDPRKRSCMPFNSSNFSSRSSLPYGSGVPVMDLGDMMSDNEFAAFNPYLCDAMGCSGESIYPGMASASRSPRMMKNRGGPMSQLHFHLEECYEQWRCLEKERKKTETTLTKTFPGNRTAAVTSTSLPKMPPNPTRVDHLIVNQIREQGRVVSLLGKMEHLRSVPLHANINSALDRHYVAICVTQARRKEEFVNMSNCQRQGRAPFRDDRDTLLLAMALKDLCATTRRTRTALWCALQMTLPKSAEKPDHHAVREATFEESSCSYSFSFKLE